MKKILSFSQVVSLAVVLAIAAFGCKVALRAMTGTSGPLVNADDGSDTILMYLAFCVVLLLGRGAAIRQNAGRVIQSDS